MSNVVASNLSVNNATSECATNVLNKHSTVKLYIYPSIPFGVIIMVLNSLVIVSVVINKRLRKPSFYYVCSLAFADFIAAFTFTYSFLRNYFNHQEVVMKELEYKQGIFVMSIGASILSLLAIALNRYFVLVHPFHYRVKMSNTVVVLVTIFIWGYSMIFGVLPIAGWNANNDDCSRIFPGLARTYVFVLSLHVVVVLVIIMALYLVIFLKVRESASFRLQEHNSYQKVHVKVAKTLFIVTVAFAVCWLPIMVIGILDMAKVITLAKYTTSLVFLAVLNSLINPIIYAYREQEMRNTFRSILCCCCCCWSRDHTRKPISNDSSRSTWLTSCFHGVNNDTHAQYERNGNAADQRRTERRPIMAKAEGVPGNPLKYTEPKV